MKTITHALAVLVLLGAGPVLAQDAGHGATALPPECTADTDHTAVTPMPDMSSTMADMDEAHKDLMATMEPMHASMTAGMMAPDPDVAFVCGMIGHHQGAIDMAKAELEHGADAWAKEQAQMIIDAQTKEIEAMTKWLQERAD